MFLLFDGLPFQTDSRDRGIGRYSANLLAGLRRVRPEWDIQLVMHAGLPAIPPCVTGDAPVLVFHTPVNLTHQSRNVVDRYYADWLTAQRADWVFQSSVFEIDGAVPFHTHPRPRTAAVLYDLIPLLFPEQYLTAPAVAAHY